MDSKQRLRKFFKLCKADALVLANGDSEASFDPNFLYYTGLEIDNSLLIARRDGRDTLLCSSLNHDVAKEAAPANFSVVKIERGKLERLLSYALHGVKSVAVNKRSMKIATYERISALKPARKFTDASEPLLEVRAVKDEFEMARIAKAVKLAKTVLDSVELSVGKSEEQIARELRIAAIGHGADVSFPSIILSGINSRIPHGSPSARKVGMNEVVLVDFGVRLGGYCSDLTRCHFTGACKEERSMYEKLKLIHDTLMDEARTGMKVADFAKHSNALFKKHKLPPLMHLIGHGIGIEVHEAPSLYEKSKMKFEAGMAIAVEPAFYGKKFGLRYENDFAFTAGSVRSL